MVVLVVEVVVAVMMATTMMVALVLCLYRKQIKKSCRRSGSEWRRPLDVPLCVRVCQSKQATGLSQAAVAAAVGEFVCFCLIFIFCWKPRLKRTSQKEAAAFSKAENPEEKPAR